MPDTTAPEDEDVVEDAEDDEFVEEVDAEAVEDEDEEGDVKLLAADEDEAEEGEERVAIGISCGYGSVDSKDQLRSVYPDGITRVSPSTTL